MTELVAPFVPVHGSCTFLPDMNCLLDPSGRSIRLSVNYRRRRPTDHMILLDCVIPYVEKVSETVARIMKKYNVPCAMKPWVTLKNVLVHPKDWEDKEQTTECVYKVSCASCEKTYIGETGRKLGVRLQEHRSEVESKTNRAFTRSHRSSSSAESNRSALTDHAFQENHVISWSVASVIDRESARSTRWIKKAVHIRKEGPRSMNRDEGSYQLSHTYDRFLGSTLTYCAKNRKKKT